MVRIVLVEDHALVASAMSTALSTFDDLEVVGQAASAADGAALLRHRQPDVALLDVRLGDELVTDHLRALRAACPRTALLLVSGWATEHVLDRALAEGARGLLGKEQPLADLVDGIRRAHRGEVVVAPGLLDALVRRATAPAAVEPPDARDLEVLSLLSEACSVGAIAEALGVAECTVRNRIRGCMAKLGTHSRVETVVEAVRRGWVLPRDNGAAARPA